MSERQRASVSEAAIESRLRVSGALVMLGLVIEIASLTWRHPTAFILFVVGGGAFMAAGMSWFLYTIVSRGGE
jgi:hypothetical protein